MSRWSDGFPPPSRPLRVEGGIKARSKRGAIAQTWWSGRFIGLLESFGMGPRLSRGRSYARAGQVLDLCTEPGAVTATVQGSRARPYRVRIELTPFREAGWARVEEVLAGQALFSAKLLAGDMPPDVEEALEDAGVALFPRSARDLAMMCSCPDWAIPCKHLAATFYLFAEELDADPFLLFVWRGRTRNALLDRLRALRGAPGPAAAREDPSWRSAMDEGVLPLTACLEVFWTHAADLAGVRRPEPSASSPDLLLRQLDPPDVEIRGRGLVEILRPWYADMAAAEPDPVRPRGGPCGRSAAQV
ncbi:MAG: hypothetical protein ACRDPT_00950 [Streptomycetales bacterium]